MPKAHEALNALALTELKLGKTGEAIERLEQVLAETPASLSTSVMLAQARLAQRDFNGAEEVLKKACESARKSSDPLVVLGRFYRSQNRMVEAEQQFRKAIEVNPAAGPALLELARLQNFLGRKTEAEESRIRGDYWPDRGGPREHRRCTGLFLSGSLRDSQPARSEKS